MKLKERSYSTKILRPKPLIHLEGDGSLIVIATSWGQPEHAQRAMDEVVKYINAAKSDVEVTSPFEFLSSLSDEVNYLRIGMLIANDSLYRGENRKEYFSGVEILALYKRGPQVAWAQVGCPSLFVNRKNQGLQALSVGLDLSSEFLDGGDVLAPLPARLLGLDPTCYMQCGDTRVDEEDQLVLLASASVAKSFWQMDRKAEFGSIAHGLIQETPDTPFWLGLVDLD